MFGWDGQWFQLFAWNQLLMAPAAIYPQLAQNTNLYLMNTTIMNDNTTSVLQQPYYTSIGESLDAQFTAYVAFSSAVVFFISSFAKCVSRSPNKKVVEE
jgi:hypothetical protein